MDITGEQLEVINNIRVDTTYTDKEAASYLNGTKNKEILTESPFVRYPNYGAGKDGYWTYRHMVIQIEDCVNCLIFLYPQFQYQFELDHSSMYTMERPDGLSATPDVINMGWRGTTHDEKCNFK